VFSYLYLWFYFFDLLDCEHVTIGDKDLKTVTQLAREEAKIIEKNKDQLKTGFDRTSLPKRHWAFEDLTFFLYKKVTDLLREKFEREGFFPEIPYEKWREMGLLGRGGRHREEYETT